MFRRTPIPFTGRIARRSGAPAVKASQRAASRRAKADRIRKLRRAR